MEGEALKSKQTRLPRSIDFVADDGMMKRLEEDPTDMDKRLGLVSLVSNSKKDLSTF